MLTVKEFLVNNPDPNARDLQGLETVHHLRVLSGVPPVTGPTDVDGVGVQKWQTVIYAAGDGPWGKPPDLGLGRLLASAARLYFLNRTGQGDDEVAQWILQQPGVMLDAADP
jgi:hypothetical protein